jgi:hypothetical protein
MVIWDEEKQHMLDHPGLLKQHMLDHPAWH